MTTITTSTTHDLRLAVIIGSVRQGRFGPVVARWFAEQARQHGRFRLDLIDLAEAPPPLVLPPDLPALSTADGRPERLAQLATRLDSADAFVVVTPEYNHSFPASIKSLIDWHYTPWRAKPVGFVSYGGVSGGLRAVEQLRLVFAEMHAVTMRDSVSFTLYWELFDADGRLRHDEHANAAAKIMLDQLAWWSAPLHDARAASPYTVAY